MDHFVKIIGNIRCHNVAGIRHCFEHGIDPNSDFWSEPLIYQLTGEYGLGPQFRQAVKAFVDNGLEFEDKTLPAVLLDDAQC